MGAALNLPVVEVEADRLVMVEAARRRSGIAGRGRYALRRSCNGRRQGRAACRNTACASRGRSASAGRRPRLHAEALQHGDMAVAAADEHEILDDRLLGGLHQWVSHRLGAGRIGPVAALADRAEARRVPVIPAQIRADATRPCRRAAPQRPAIRRRPGPRPRAPERRSVLHTTTIGCRCAASSGVRAATSASGTLSAPGRWPGGAVNSSGCRTSTSSSGSPAASRRCNSVVSIQAGCWSQPAEQMRQKPLMASTPQPADAMPRPWLPRRSQQGCRGCCRDAPRFWPGSDRRRRVDGALELIQ